MSILRQHKVSNFTTVSNEFIGDERLSYKAKGILLWLLAKPDGWELREYAISNASPSDGRAAVSTGVHELIDAGYVSRRKVQNEKGHWIWETHVSEISTFDPSTEGTEVRKSDVGLSDLGNPDRGKPGLKVNTYSSNTDLTNTHHQGDEEKIELPMDQIENHALDILARKALESKSDIKNPRAFLHVVKENQLTDGTAERVHEIHVADVTLSAFDIAETVNSYVPKPSSGPGDDLAAAAAAHREATEAGGCEKCGSTYCVCDLLDAAERDSAVGE